MFTLRSLLVVGTLVTALVPSAFAITAQEGLNRGSFVINVAEALTSPEVIKACPNMLSPDPYTLLFTDVSRGNSFFAETCFLMRAGIVRGYADGSFHPSDGITRAEAAKILAKAFRPDAVLSSPETPVWYERYVNVLRSAGYDILKASKASDGMTYEEVTAAIRELAPVRAATE